MRKCRRDTWLTASSESSYLVKYLCISSYIRKIFLIYDFVTDHIHISLCMRKISLSFLSVFIHFLLFNGYVLHVNETCFLCEEMYLISECWLLCLFFYGRRYFLGFVHIVLESLKVPFLEIYLDSRSFLCGAMYSVSECR
jgi:hypothetical protein